jgi:predicted enzyme related to lactoylglutathione lyase
MLNLNSVMIFSEDPRSLADFYTKVLEKQPDMAEGGYYGFSVGDTFLNIGPHDKVSGKSSYPERIMINFETDEVESEFERVKSLGAAVIAKPYQMDDDEKVWVATFADPDGNYFQLMTPWK